jgi:hypothetical protein
MSEHCCMTQLLIYLMVELTCVHNTSLTVVVTINIHFTGILFQPSTTFLVLELWNFCLHFRSPLTDNSYQQRLKPPESSIVCIAGRRELILQTGL